MRVDTLRAKVEDADGISPGSSAQVAAVLLGDGIPLIEKTKTILLASLAS
jgi:hypothetical protein